MSSFRDETALDQTTAVRDAAATAATARSEIADDATMAVDVPQATIERTAGPEAPIVAGYDVTRLIGQGGMGVVWEAVDHRLGRTVALKVHADDAQQTDALWIEARLAAKITHPGIVPIHEVGLTVSGRPYYTMDLVEGTSLRTMMRDGPMSPRRALEITRTVAEAIGFAHARGIVHCDLKPGNIMVDVDGRARVLDFGLAFAISGASATKLGPLRGSPPYMSPEQITGDALTAATDVYSLGVVLYEMLAGELPFHGADLDALLAAITFASPEPLTSKARNVSAEIERACLACLSKTASERPPNGRALARQLRALLDGDVASSPDEAPAYVPRRASFRPATPLPEPSTGARSYRFELALASPPSRLWPLISNTERINRAAGLPQITFEEVASPKSAARKLVRFRVLGMDIAWEEHPFEWVFEREHSVVRQHCSGPLLWLKNHVTVASRSGGGTTLVHEVTVMPRGALGVVSAFFEIQWKLGKRLTTVYQRLDEIAARTSTDADPFEPPHEPSAAQIERVSSGIARLRPDRRFSGALLERLRALLLSAPDKRLERIRPYVLAASWNERREEVLDLLLHAANVGLVDIAWDLWCPVCNVPHDIAPSLAQISGQGSCTACGEVYTRDLVGSVELIFRPHREVRDVGTGVYCLGSPAGRSHVLLQQVVAPSSERGVTVTLPRCDLLFRAERHPGTAEVSSSPAGLARSCEVRVGRDGITVSPPILFAGEVEIALVNETNTHQVIRLEKPPQKADSVTAAAAMTHPTFQGFFSSELLSEGQHLRVSHMAFVALEIEDRAHVLQELGDATAFARFSDLCRRTSEIAAREQGTLCRASFDGLLAAFSATAPAVRAALALAEEHREQGALAVRVAVHAGRCIAVSLGTRTEYFGETVERARALLGDAIAGTVAASSAVDDDPAALMAMQVPGVDRTVGTSRAGHYGGRRVVRLALA